MLPQPIGRCCWTASVGAPGEALRPDGRVLFDTAIFVYTVGGEHAYREPCRALVRRAGVDEIHGVITAVFAAVALGRGVRHVLSPDRAFDAVPGLTRVDPPDVVGVAALSA